MNPRLSFISLACAVPGLLAASAAAARRLFSGLALAAALALGAGDAAAQQGVFNECNGTGLTNLVRTLWCTYGVTDTTDHVIVVTDPQIVVKDDFLPAIEYKHEGRGDLEVWVKTKNPVHPPPRPELPGGFRGILTGGDGFKYDPRSFGRHLDGDEYWGYADGEENHGVHAAHTGSGRVGIVIQNPSIMTTGPSAFGVWAWQRGGYVFVDGAAKRAQGVVIVKIEETDRDREERERPLIATHGQLADAIRAEYTRRTASGHIAVTIEGYAVATGDRSDKTRAALTYCRDLPVTTYEEIAARATCFDMVDEGRHLSDAAGFSARGVYTAHEGRGDIRIKATDTEIATWGAAAQGIYATHAGMPYSVPEEGGGTLNVSGGGEVDIDVTGSRIVTGGGDAHGIYGLHRGLGGVDIDLENVTIETAGRYARGVFGRIRPFCIDTDERCEGDNVREGSGAGDLAIDVTGGSISTTTRRAYAIHARHENEGDIAVLVTGEAALSTEGAAAHAVFAEHAPFCIDNRFPINNPCEGDNVSGRTAAAGDIVIDVTGGAALSTEGDGAHAVYAEHIGAGGDEDENVTVTVSGATITTAGSDADGVLAHHGGGRGGLEIRMTDGAVRAMGSYSVGLHALRTGAGAGAIAVTVSGGSVTSNGADGIGAIAHGKGDITVGIDRGATVTGNRVGLRLISQAAEGSTPNLAVSVGGTVTSSSGRGIYMPRGSVTIAATGRVAAPIGNTAVFSDGPGDLTVTVQGQGRAEGDIRAAEGTLIFALSEGGTVTGTVHAPTAAAAGPLAVRGSVGRILYDAGGAATIAPTGRITGIDGEAIRNASGDLTVTVQGQGRAEGDIRAAAGKVIFESLEGSVVTGTVYDPAGPDSAPLVIRGSVGRLVWSGAGAVTIAPTGRITGVDGEAIRNDSGDLTVTVQSRLEGDLRPAAGKLILELPKGSVVTGTVYDATAPDSAPFVVYGSVGRIVYSAGGAATVAAGGAVTGVTGTDGGLEAVVNRTGDLTLSIAGKVTGAVKDLGGGDMTVTVRSGGELAGDIHGLGEGAHAVTVERNGRIAGRLLGRYTLRVLEGGEVVGTIWDPGAGTSIGGAIAAVRYTNGGSIVIAATGRVIGVDIPGVGRRAIYSADGDLTVEVAKGAVVESAIEGAGDEDLSVTVSGEVKGDVIARGHGAHAVTVRDGGKIRRAMFDRGGSVTVEAGGQLTGADGVAARSARGAFTATVAGRAEGDIRADGGTLTLAVPTGGTVTGTVQAPTGELTIGGSVSRILYSAGGSVTVAAGGAVTGVSGDADAIRSAGGDLTVDVAKSGSVAGNIRGLGDGDLDVDVSGSVTGGIFGLGDGEHNVHVMSGGSVSGMIHLAASTVTVDGASGPVLFDKGGEVRVGAGGRIEGADGEAAIRSTTGDLTVLVAAMGTVRGDISGRGAGEHGLTVARGGSVTGTVDLASGEVVIDGSVGRVRLDSGSALTVGESGRIQGVDGQTIVVVSGAPEVVVRRGADESAEDAIGRIGGGKGVVDAGGKPKVTIKREGEDDIVVEVDDDGTLRVVPPRRQPAAAGDAVYESLPSVLMALTAFPEFGGALASAGAGRAAAGSRGSVSGGDMAGMWRGAWARLHAGRGDRSLASASAGGAHEVRRFGFEAGMEGAIGENALVSVSAHHVRGEADVNGAEGGGMAGGDAEVAGTGARLAGAWFPAAGYYVGGQASATLYEADLTSADPQVDGGALARDISGRGYAVGAEAGRRFDMGRLAVTPRARLNWSRVDMSSFTDAMGDRVSLDGRSIKARAGVRVEAAAPAGSVFATVDVERELSGKMRATVADRSLESEAEDTWARLGLGGAHEWGGGRFVLRGDANYAAARNGNRDFGGSASLTVRF